MIDTDTCIHVARGNVSILKKLRDQRREDLRISIFTVSELEVGVRKVTIRPLEKRRALDEFFSLLRLRHWDSDLFRWDSDLFHWDSDLFRWDSDLFHWDSDLFRWNSDLFHWDAVPEC